MELYKKCENAQCSEQLVIRPVSSKKRWCFKCQARKRKYNTMDAEAVETFKSFSRKHWGICFELDKRQFYHVGVLPDKQQYWFNEFIGGYITKNQIIEWFRDGVCQACKGFRHLCGMGNKKARDVEDQSAGLLPTEDGGSFYKDFHIRRRDNMYPHFLENCMFVCQDCLMSERLECDSVTTLSLLSYMQLLGNGETFVDGLTPGLMLSMLRFIVFSQERVNAEQTSFFNKLFESYILKDSFLEIFKSFEVERVYFSENKMHYQSPYVDAQKDFTFTKHHFGLVGKPDVRQINKLAFRHAVVDQITDFRSRFFSSENIGFFACELCTRYVFDAGSDAHVDHDFSDPDCTFSALMSRFCERECVDVGSTLLVSIDKETLWVSLESESLSRKFQDFHKENSKLRVICRECNRWTC